MNLVKAELQELKPDFSAPKPGGARLTVQFNPDSLKVSYANQIESPNGPGSQKGNTGSLHIGSRTTKMTLQLWFDATRADGASSGADVRQMTEGVLYFMRPKPPTGQRNESLVPPALRFLWGSFHFDGVLESAEETLDYWSHDGKPLRASLNLSMSQQIIETFNASQASGKAQQLASLLGQPGSPTAGRPAGTTPLTAARSGATVQGLSDLSGNLDWQGVAAANGIENPRLLDPGQLLNLNPVIPFR
jgi:hypothetical protein